MLTSGRMMDKTIVRPDEMPESKLSSMKNIGVLPDYELSTANIPCSVMNHFGVPAPQPALASILQQAKGAEKVVFFFVDGLGSRQVQRLPRTALLRKLAQKTKPLTAVFPSTTAASVATFATGLTPQEHGILGYTLYIKEFRTVVDMLQYRSKKTGKKIAIKPRQFFPFPTIYQRLGNAGVRSCCIGPSHLKNTTFSRMVYPGCAYIGYKSFEGLFVRLQKLLRKPGKLYVQCYIADYDTLCHEYGPNSPLPLLFLAYFNQIFERFMRTARAKKTLIILSSDHGHISTNPEKLVLYAHHPLLKAALKAVAGEARMNYLHCKPGKQRIVEAYFKKHLRNAAHIIPSEQALETGLFGAGAINARTRERIGDFVVIPKKNFTLAAMPTPLIGHHGGLSEHEMRVPLILYRFK